MNPDNETMQADTATERLMLWSEALRYLAEEGLLPKLVLALNTGDRERFDALIRPIRFFEPGACIDICRYAHKNHQFRRLAHGGTL